MRNTVIGWSAAGLVVFLLIVPVSGHHEIAAKFDPTKAVTLRGVVTEEGGTAYKERLNDVDMSGKTGTAQTSHVTQRELDSARAWYFNREHAWFAGFAPAKSPEIAIVVLPF